MTSIVYIRMQRKIRLTKHSLILMKDIADLSTLSEEKDVMEHLPIYRTDTRDNNLIIIDSLTVMDRLTQYFPTYEFELLGVSETIVEIRDKTKKVNIFLVSFVWLLLFIGTAMTIINFHEDVSMQAVHQKIHYIFTGEEKTHPLRLQIPYSIGLGVGMVVFLNRLFKRKLNDEPSPLEIELFKYGKDMNEYVMYRENKLNKDDSYPNDN